MKSDLQAINNDEGAILVCVFCKLVELQCINIINYAKIHHIS